VEQHRAAVTEGAAQAQGRAATRAGPGGADRDSVRAQDRHSLGVPAPRDGLRLRHDLLAALAGLEPGRGLASAAHRVAGPSGRNRSDRLEPCQSGQWQPAGQKGGPETGPNPTDRAKAGAKDHLLVDRHGVPLAAWQTAANDHDSQLFEPVIELVEPIKRPRGRPRARPEKQHADKAYDIPRCHAYLKRRGILDRIARKGIESSEKLGRFRWVAERTIAWLFQFRRLAVRWERRDDIAQALLDFGCALICFRMLP
jgi:Transposase DDE domain